MTAALFAEPCDEQDAVVHAVARDDRAEECGRRVEVADSERGDPERDERRRGDVCDEQREQALRSQMNEQHEPDEHAGDQRRQHHTADQRVVLDLGHRHATGEPDLDRRVMRVDRAGDRIELALQAVIAVDIGRDERGVHDDRLAAAIGADEARLAEPRVRVALSRAQVGDRRAAGASSRSTNNGFARRFATAIWSRNASRTASRSATAT